MDIQEVISRVAQVCDAAAAGDDEAAHALEDRLYFDVLTTIASGIHNPADLASEAIKTSTIDFARYCA